MMEALLKRTVEELDEANGAQAIAKIAMEYFESGAWVLLKFGCDGVERGDPAFDEAHEVFWKGMGVCEIRCVEHGIMSAQDLKAALTVEH